MRARDILTISGDLSEEDREGFEEREGASGRRITIEEIATASSETVCLSSHEIFTLCRPRQPHDKGADRMCNVGTNAIVVFGIRDLCQ